MGKEKIWKERKKINGEGKERKRMSYLQGESDLVGVVEV